MHSCVPVPSLLKNLRWYLLDARSSEARIRACMGNARHGERHRGPSRGYKWTLNTDFNTNMVLIKDTVDCTGLVLGLELCANGGTSAFQPLLTTAVAQPWFVQNTITVLHGDTVDCTGLVLERQTEWRVPLASYNVRIVSAINAFTVVTATCPDRAIAHPIGIASDRIINVASVWRPRCTHFRFLHKDTHTHARAMITPCPSAPAPLRSGHCDVERSPVPTARSTIHWCGPPRPKAAQDGLRTRTCHPPIRSSRSLTTSHSIHHRARHMHHTLNTSHPAHHVLMVVHTTHNSALSA